MAGMAWLDLGPPSHASDPGNNRDPFHANYHGGVPLPRGASCPYHDSGCPILRSWRKIGDGRTRRSSLALSITRSCFARMGHPRGPKIRYNKHTFTVAARTPEDTSGTGSRLVCSVVWDERPRGPRPAARGMGKLVCPCGTTGNKSPVSCAYPWHLRHSFPRHLRPIVYTRSIGASLPLGVSCPKKSIPNGTQGRPVFIDLHTQAKRGHGSSGA